MDAIASIRERIPQFGGYDDLDARRADDELIRSYVGEALAALNAGHPDYFADAADAYESVIIRAGFMNQLAFRSFEYADLDPAKLAAISENDLALVDLADEAKTVQAGDVAAYLAKVNAAFDRRDAAMRDAGGAIA